MIYLFLILFLFAFSFVWFNNDLVKKWFTEVLITVIADPRTSDLIGIFTALLTKLQNGQPTINYRNRFIQIDYIKNGSPYQILLPYKRRSRSVTVTGFKAEGLDPIVINHPPGVPFLVTPNDLGLNEIQVETATETKIYKGDDQIHI